MLAPRGDGQKSRPTSMHSSRPKRMPMSIDRFVAQGDTVVAIGHYSAQVKSTGKSIDSPVMLAFEFQDGKIKRHLVMGDTAAITDSYTAAAAAAR
jgi:ketosteroid isomerase-like protein